ncbi:unnamed protein product [Camellia sinensis]
MDSKLCAVPLFATQATPSPAELYPKPKLSLSTSSPGSSSFSSVPIKAPPIVDSDFEFSLSTNGQENYSSSYESGSAFESDGFVSGEDGFDMASEKLFVTDPDDESLGESRVVEDCVVSRPFVTDPDEKTLEITMEEEEEEEEYVDEPLRKQGAPIAMLLRDSDDDSVGSEEEEDDGVLGSVRVPGIRISEKTEVEGGEDESQFEPVMGSSEGCIALKGSNIVFIASHSRSVRILEKMDTKFDPEEVIEEFEMLTKDAERYLKKWGLNGRTDHESFKAFVPLVTHKDLEPYIQRMVDGDTSPILTGKPITTISLREFPIGNGKALQFICSSKQFKTKGGLAAGTATTNVFSVQVVSSTFAHGNVYAFRTFEQVWEELCTDIREGVLTSQITVPSVRTAMSKLLKPNPELTGAISQCKVHLWDHDWVNGTLLKKLRHYAGELPLLSADYGSSEGWIGANVNPKLPPELATFAVLPNIGYFEFIPNVEVPKQDEIESSFLSIEPKTVGLTEVKVGEEYEIILTTFAANKLELSTKMLAMWVLDTVRAALSLCSGLYRYRLGDVVKVVGFHNYTPELQFIYRSNLLLTINIDKNTEKDVQLSIEAAGKLFSNEKLEVVDFTSHVDLSTDPGHYVIFWEVSGEASDDLLRECCNCLDWSFVDAGYVGSRKVKAIGELELRVLKRGTFQKILEHYVGLGVAVSQFKTPRCMGPANSTVLQILCNNVVKNYFSTAF